MYTVQISGKIDGRKTETGKSISDSSEHPHPSVGLPSPRIAVPQSSNPGHDKQNILRQSYDYLTIMPDHLDDGRLIYRSSHDYRKMNLR